MLVFLPPCQLAAGSICSFGVPWPRESHCVLPPICWLDQTRHLPSLPAAPGPQGPCHLIGDAPTPTAMSVTHSSASLFLWLCQIFLSLLHSRGSKCKRYKRLYGDKFLPESPSPPDLFSEATSMASVLRNPRDVFMGCVLCVCACAHVCTHTHTHACTHAPLQAYGQKTIE